MDLQLQAEIRAGVQPLDAHGRQLARQRLAALAVGAQRRLVRPVVRAHVGRMERHQPRAGVGQDRRLVVARIVRLVRVDRRTGGQPVGQFVDGGAVVPSARRAVERHRHPSRGADQVPPPAAEPLLLGGTIATARLAAQLARAAGAGALPQAPCPSAAQARRVARAVNPQSPSPGKRAPRDASSRPLSSIHSRCSRPGFVPVGQATTRRHSSVSIR